MVISTKKATLGCSVLSSKTHRSLHLDFYAPKAKLVVEVDGSQHMESNNLERDTHRDEYMNKLGLKVLRFNSRQILEETDEVLEVIYRTLHENPL